MENTEKIVAKSDKYLSLDNTNCLKGILSICILLCHLWGEIAIGNAGVSTTTLGKILGPFLTAMGYLSVALFFFLSGYGLSVQYKTKGEGYLKGFLVKRVLPLYLINVLLIVFYSVVRLLLAEEITLKAFLLSFLFGNTVISKGWYLQAIILWYLIFFFVFRFVKKENFRISFLILVFFIYVITCVLLKLDSTWYESAFCLIIGVLWGIHAKRINSFFADKKTLIFSLVILLVSFIGFFVFSKVGAIPMIARIVSKALSACVFTVLVIVLLKIIPINNLITRFLGKISLETYVIHGFFLMLFRCEFIYVKNFLLYSLLVIGCSIILAWLIHPIFARIFKICKRGKNYGNQN